MPGIVENVIAALEAKNGENIISLDLKNKGSLADTFVIVTGNSETHMKTLAEAAEEALEREGRRCKIEGEHSVNWRLIDAGDIVVHVFSHKGREFYRLERLWEN
ncbi:MAG: ribosome silencing factor [Synergistales bacterium]|nr:ribosome silencing factor [Synergistales bacterium]MDY6402059.1 ribosome silencing factor [Synergistales bacterium]MDY6404013.1 ribosome silencing factor [Synergistales bacterium]MDY6410814.1 ribosome silencing factor [Synergistales bacterium]MDY6413834.1 ribosome silencing factor [Synergistales bacterium]